MEDISSVFLLIIFAILSVGIRLYKKAMSQPESEQPTPMKKDWEPVSVKQEEESDLPIAPIYHAPVKTEQPRREQPAKKTEKAENPAISDDFDVAKAVIYSEILKPRTFDEY
ncbi:MAG: hypothetical protein K2H25_06190 [Alistipes sp.]|nr:hypothetical protein [Alistipes sp.]